METKRCLLVQPKRKWQRDPKSAGSLDEMAMEEPRYTIASLSFMWLRTEVREEKTKSSLSLCERTRCVCVGGVSWFNCFLLWGTHVLPVDVPRLEVISDVHEQASAIARAMWDPSCIWDLQHSSGQPRILILLKEAGMECASSQILGGFMSAEP